MYCPSHNNLIAFSLGQLNAVEKMIVRDHLVSCKSCRTVLMQYKLMEYGLKEPVFIEPPIEIEQVVMKALFPSKPSRVSLMVLITASITLFVSLLYVSFDFSNNGILQALQLTTSETTNLLGALIRMVSGGFKIVYALYKIADAVTRAFSFGFITLDGVVLFFSVLTIFVIKKFHRNISIYFSGRPL